MKLENQVCTREQGERLEELGINGKPLFCWCYVSISSEESIAEILPTIFDLKLPDIASTWIAPAFTVAELGIMLPDIYAEFQWVSISNAGYNSLSINMEPPNCFSIHIGEAMDRLDHEAFNHELYPTEAQARAAYLIHLLESKAIDIQEINQKLNS